MSFEFYVTYMKTVVFFSAFIFFLVCIPSIAQESQGNTSLVISGKIASSKNIFNPLKNGEIALVDQKGTVLSITTTDQKGFFKFENLDASKRYMIELNDANPGFDNKSKFALIDTKSGIIRETGVDGIGGKMVFRDLPVNPYTLPQVTPEDVKFGGKLLVGDKSPKPLENTKINLLNEKGEIIQTSATNGNGGFMFTNYQSDQNNKLQVDDIDSGLPKSTKIVLTNKTGKEVLTASTGSNGGFEFTFSASDKNIIKLMTIENSELRVDFNGRLLGDDRSPIANSIINIMNEKGQIMRSTKTDGEGDFKFISLPGERSILLALGENNALLKKYKKIFLTNTKGVTVKEILRGDHGFKFSILQSDRKKLEVEDVEDPWIKLVQLKTDVASKDPLKTDNISGNMFITNLKSGNTVTIVENIYYNTGETKVTPVVSKTLDKLIGVMKEDPKLSVQIVSHTDSRSSSEFNMRLSVQRATAAVNYIIRKGIASKRVTGKGYGETKLINKCGDGIDCSEEEHAKNRRTEFKIERSEKIIQ